MSLVPIKGLNSFIAMQWCELFFQIKNSFYNIKAGTGQVYTLQSGKICSLLADQGIGVCKTIEAVIESQCKINSNMRNTKNKTYYYLNTTPDIISSALNRCQSQAAGHKAYLT